MKEKTVERPTFFRGVGLHSGKPTLIKILPRSGGGVVFENEKREKIRALYNFVIDAGLGVTISNGKITVRTIEHLMAAIFACNLDNLTIRIEGEEAPIMDGSAEVFIKHLKKAGVRNLKNNRKYLKILKSVEYSEGDKFIKITPADNFSIDMTVDFPYGNIGRQRALWDGQSQMFSARTFCNKKEIEYMQANGLARGGSLENAMVFDENGLMNAGGARMENEVANHKILDCVGDLFASGYYLRGKVEANKTGHGLNNNLLRKLFGDKNNYEVEK
ncbi:MAG: UDP-3-O-acyl-N-acetylglucosamine deacetylase [Rickettsiales bacterium]|jgi:UDP-3-O-[3-hydroxymyristoyl] N-acetylglucosamine deacetylase|nr:UDP-3-O-acyl-N-acetylglucosamine deacetylase [Rickettsiales bacterium]